MIRLVDQMARAFIAQFMEFIKIASAANAVRWNGYIVHIRSRYSDSDASAFGLLSPLSPVSTFQCLYIETLSPSCLFYLLGKETVSETLSRQRDSTLVAECEIQARPRDVERKI